MAYGIRQLEPNDYEDILIGWWKDWRWTAPPKDSLPEEGVGGVMVYDGDTPVCAGFLYITNSKIAWVEWVVSNFQYKDRSKRKEAISLLVDTLTETARNMGFKYSYAVLKNENLINTYKDIGYTIGSSNNIEMIKKL